MSDMHATIYGRGQMVIPADARREAGIGQGDVVGFEDRNPRFGTSGRTFTITASLQSDPQLDPKVPPRQFPQISDG
jgi:hypothetical protein